MALEHITPLLNVEDVQRSLDFYTSALGFELGNRWESEGKLMWARIKAGPVELMLNGRGAGEDARRRARPGHHDVVLYIGVDDVVPLHARLLADGLAPGEIHDEEYGLRQFSLRDPDGYELALTSRM
jgi:catechol 2,3-dioxygenase-like lactoylglutathione lyase family enzyme